MTLPDMTPLAVRQRGTEPIVVAARRSTPGLYTHRTPNTEIARPICDQWRISHHSGRLLATFPSERQARCAGVAVAQFADWTRSDDELFAAAQAGDIDLYAVGAVIERHGGQLLRERVLLPTDFVTLTVED